MLALVSVQTQHFRTKEYQGNIRHAMVKEILSTGSNILNLYLNLFLVWTSEPKQCGPAVQYLCVDCCQGWHSALCLKVERVKV